jgi:hypothetical protein
MNFSQRHAAILFFAITLLLNTAFAQSPQSTLANTAGHGQDTPIDGPVVRSGSESLGLTVNSKSGTLVETSIVYGAAVPIGLQPNQTVDVSVQFPAERAGESIPLSVWDGGKISTANKDALVGSDGRLTFAFQAGSAPGLYRVVLQPASEEYCVRFWVIDPNQPEKKPRLSLAN